MKASDLEGKMQAALTFLHERAGEHAQARANYEYMAEWPKLEMQRIKGLLVGIDSDTAKTAEAMRHKSYQEALQAKKEADEAWFTVQFKRQAAEAILAAWQTLSANERRLP